MPDVSAEAPKARCTAGLFPLKLHLGLKACVVDAEAGLAGYVLGEVHREAEGVVERKDINAGDQFLTLCRQGRKDLIQQAQAPVQGLQETFLLVGNDLVDEILPA